MQHRHSPNLTQPSITVRSGRVRAAAAAGALAVLLGACATTPRDNALQQPPLEQLVDNAGKAAAAGDREAALKQLSQAATANPTSAKPWVVTAQMEFEAGNYPATIQAADEAMKRDADSKEAKALAVVASLRVAVQALAEMRKDMQLNGSTRTEAEQLARSLRDTLGEDVLVPLLGIKPAPAKRATTAPKKKPAATAAATADTAPAPAPAKPTTPQKSAGGNDPFGALR